MTRDLASEYFPTLYGSDIAALTGRESRPSLSICSFVPDYPDVPFFSEPAKGLKRLRHRTLLECAMFWETLCDQATYSVTRRGLTARGWPGPGAKLVGLLGTMHTNLHPAFLLIAMSFRHGLDPVVVGAALETVGPSILRALGETAPGESERIARHIYWSIEAGSIPDSIRAFVPHGDRYRRKPDWARVEEWRQRAQAVVAEVFPQVKNPAQELSDN